MNMKKIAILALSLCMIAAIAVTGTIAYFADTDAQLNVFTTGNVKIDLYEDFANNDGNPAHLMPVTYDENGDRKADNVVEKEVFVKNIGTEDAYVRVHIAFPSMLDSGSEDEPQFASYNNTLHWNFTADSYADGKWNWNADKDGENYPGNGGAWNFYQTSIDGILYNVYVATYETAIASGNGTCDAMSQVYLDKKVTNEMIDEIKEVLKDEWKIYVVAEGVQKAGFDDAYTALNTEFGVPGSTGYVAPNFLATAENDTWLNN